MQMQMRKSATRLGDGTHWQSLAVIAVATAYPQARHTSRIKLPKA
jgi:hypothetical protein